MIIIIKAIFFDVMGVIFKEGDDARNLLIPFVQSLKPKLSKIFINELYCKARIGEITSHKFFTACGFDSDIEIIEKEYLDSCLVLDDAFLPTANELKKAYSIYLLSNDVAEWSKYLRKKHCIDEVITHAIISGDVHMIKPNSDIFLKALEIAELPAEQCIFIDDRIKNVNAAAELGINTILFNREQLNYNGLQVTNFAELPVAISSFNK